MSWADEQLGVVEKSNSRGLTNGVGFVGSTIERGHRMDAGTERKKEKAKARAKEVGQTQDGGMQNAQCEMQEKTTKPSRRLWVWPSCSPKGPAGENFTLVRLCLWPLWPSSNHLRRGEAGQHLKFVSQRLLSYNRR